ncbi:MAG TPA: hypothetical protein VK892_17725, partial [Pyrinomonadaceae bacterium]|nr:hypothetical protein [Pyrinomonadaceae bacterium]
MKQRLQDLASPFTKARKTVFGYVSRPFESLTGTQRFWIGFTLLCVLTTLLISNPFWRGAAAQYQEGDIARESVISPADITVPDDEATERLRQSARESIQPIFTYDSNRAEEAVQNFRSSWESLLRKPESANANGSDKTNANSKTNANAKPEIKWKGAGNTEEVGKVFAARTFSSNELETIIRVLRESASGSIYDDRDRQYFQSQIILMDRQRPNQQSIISMPESSMTALSEARKNLRSGLENIRSLSSAEVEAFNTALAPLIQPSINYDSVATEKAREGLTQTVEPLTISLKRGQTVVREGDTITPEILSQISAIRNYSTNTRNTNRFFGLLALISALFWAAWKYIQHRGIVPRLTLSEDKTFALFGFIVLAQTALMAVFFRLAEFTAAQNYKAPLNDPTLWAFAIPFAFGSLLMTLLADRRTALFTGIFLSLIAGMLAPKPLEFVLFAVIASAVAVYGIGRYRTRQSVTIAGILVGLASAAAAVALIGYTQQPFILNTVLLAIACGLGSGLATAAVTAVFLPICETIFGIL